MNGTVIYSSGGNYKVLVDKKIYRAKPLGIFKNDKIKILVGDKVQIQINENKEGLKEINIITKLYERKNVFDRPNISNIDYAIIVTSIVEPEINDYYLDKLITIFQSRKVEPIIIFSKKDLSKDKHSNIIDEYKDAGFKVLCTSLKITKDQKDILYDWIKDKVSVITGQTGVGKSTFINNINGSFNLHTQEISKALGRGKHTTRHSEVFEVFDNSYIIDTPGFSSLEDRKITKEVLSWNFFNFEKYANDCKYNNCFHISETKCKIKEIGYSERTMKNYKKLFKEISNIKNER